MAEIFDAMQEIVKNRDEFSKKSQISLAFFKIKFCDEKFINWLPWKCKHMQFYTKNTIKSISELYDAGKQVKKMTEINFRFSALKAALKANLKKQV